MALGFNEEEETTKAGHVFVSVCASPPYLQMSGFKAENFRSREPVLVCAAATRCSGFRVVFPQVPSAHLMSVVSAGWPRCPQCGGDKRFQTPEPLVSTVGSRLRQRD